MHKVLTIGEVLVEIVAATTGDGFQDAQPLVGPFPSGAPAIFIDQLGKLGTPAAIVSRVGDDDFGRLNIDRLRADGVDVSGIEIAPGESTGSAFVRYRDDGSRSFVYNIRNSACGNLRPTAASEALIDGCDHLHVMGTALSAPGLGQMVMQAARRIKAQGGTISFDPNLRPEILDAPGLRKALEDMLEMTDLFMPSGDELFLFDKTRDEAAAVAALLARGIRTVVLKRGADGASLFEAAGRVDAAPLRVHEVDPTGAGDSFGGAFLSFWLADAAPEQALRYANAAGARAVTRLGPMEGTSTRAELDALLAGQAGDATNANSLKDIAAWRDRPGPSGIPSICTAHPLAIEAAMRATLPTPLPLLIEATCNQVNQEGGYTGMTPADFRRFVEDIADRVGFPTGRLILGGDHLGPNPWKDLPADQAMDKAEVMIRAYAAAGFTKLHLDCSMGAAGEPVALDDAETARRAARLAQAAEEARPDTGIPPVYIIGTEVPIPGGAMEEIEGLELTAPDAARTTVAVHKDAFAARGLEDAFDRVIGLVVQPGVEFGNHNVVGYDPVAATDLSAALSDMPGLVYEAHSTDYQTREALTALVNDGFSILKVGPGLTFVLREALYGLDDIAEELFPGQRDHTLRATMEQVMLANPRNWDRYYHGSDAERALQRHFSYSDRIRYYWPDPQAAQAVAELFDLLGERDLPETLIGQYLGGLYPDVRAGRLAPRANALALAAVQRLTQDYVSACGGA